LADPVAEKPQSRQGKLRRNTDRNASLVVDEAVPLKRGKYLIDRGQRLHVKNGAA